MAESALLVPVPFYPPVRTGAGTFFKFGEKSRHPALFEPRAHMVAPETDEGFTYSGCGCFITEALIGTRLNIYV